MKMRLFFWLLLLGSCYVQIIHAQYVTSTVTSSGFAYKSVSNDPLNARIYTLANGLTIYLSQYKDAPRVQTYIAVKAGSKMDPSSLTGLAHYLEHMVFKGTSKIGSTQYESEKLHLDQIENLFEKYRNTIDTMARKKIYKQIDSISNLAAKFAIANEYDKILSVIGAEGTNAYTFVEQTVYVNNIPANEIQRWATIESERFSELIPRLFHTELEAVYEEKNRSLDNDMSKVIEATFNAMFPNHQYGSQTTIGTVEHLKNPSITALKNYFNTYYVPNNMAICMSGDIDFDKTIKILNETFGKLKAKPVPKYVPYVEEDIKSVISRNVIGPSPQSITLCWRFPGAQNKDAMLMEMFSRILSNGKAGLMDLNLVQPQKVLNIQSFPFRMKDYSIHLIFAMPRADQTLDEVKNLILQQIDSIKQGRFNEQLLKAIILNEKLALMKQLESNAERADYFLDAFIKDIDWATYLKQLNDMGELSKDEIVAFANKYYQSNYSVVYKNTGKDDGIQKISKPQITPVEVNRDKQSEYYTKIMQLVPPKIQPVFLDFKKDFSMLKTSNGIEVNYKQNVENQIFYLDYIIDIGNEHNNKFALALRYLNYLGTNKYSPEQIKKEFYNMACSYNINIGDDKMQISLSGLSQNIVPSLQLFEHLLAKPKVDTSAYRKLVESILKERADAKLDKRTILFKAMFAYSIYGEKSPFTNIIPENELKKINPSELIDIISNLLNYKHKIRYYGPLPQSQLLSLLDKEHTPAMPLKPIPPKINFQELDFTQNKVLFVDYDMVQTELAFIAKSAAYDASLAPIITLFNEYFGGSMSSIVFQEMRESKALAYSTFSRFSPPKNKNYSYFNLSYIGTQSDKLNEAATGLKNLLDSVPYAESTLKNAKESIINTINTERITKGAIMVRYDELLKYGINYDNRKDIYNKIPTLNFSDITSFHKKYIKNKYFTLLVIGSKDKINLKDLEKFGTVKVLNLKDIFGY